MPVFEFEFDGKRYEVEAPDRDSAANAFRAQFAPEQGQEQRPGFMEFVNQGITQGLGFPVDMVTSGLNLIPGVDIQEPFGGSASISSGMSTLGIPVAAPDVAPEGIIENVAAGVGGAAGFLGPYTGVASALSRGAGMSANVGQALMQPFTDAPRRALASELMAGAGAGAGMGIAEIADPDNPLLSLAGALLGGVAGGLGPYAASQAIRRTPLVGGAVRFAQGEIAPFTQQGAMERASNRLGNLVSDPDAAIAALDAPNPGGLTPAQQTGDRRLMALEQAVRATDPVADEALSAQNMRSNIALQDALMGPGQGVDSNISRMYLDRAISDQVDSLGPTLDRALGTPQGVHTAETDIRIGSAPARQTAYDAAWEAPIDYSSQEWDNLANIISRVELSAPGTISRANQLIAGDLDAARPSPIRTRTNEDGTIAFVENPTTQQIDYITRALNGLAAGQEGTGVLGGTTDLGRMYSRLSAEIRRNLREVNPAYANALDTAATPIGQREALLLGETMLDRNVPRDYISSQISSMTQPEIEFVRQGVRSSLDETLANVRTTLSNPDVGMAQAQQLLREMTAPAMRQKLSLILPDDELNALFNDLDRTRNLLDPRGSGAAIFTSARPNEEINAIINAQNPSEAAAQLVREASSDPTGQALAGVKGAFIDNLMNASRSGFDDAGNALISGRGLTSQLNNSRVQQVAEQVLSPEELSQFRQIVDEFSRLETARGNLPGVGSVMEGEPNSIVSLLVRTIAARQGARAGRGTSGASLLTANFASQRANRILNALTLDRAEALIREAVLGDRELFQALLSPNGPRTAAQENALAAAAIRTMVGTAGAASDSLSPDPLPFEGEVPTDIPQITVNYDSGLAGALMGR